MLRHDDKAKTVSDIIARPGNNAEQTRTHAATRQCHGEMREHFIFRGQNRGPYSPAASSARRAIALPMRCTTSTTSALPMQNARWPSVMPVAVQPFGKVCS